MFLGVLASDAPATVTIGPTAAVTTHRVAAISGDPTADANEWGFSRSGESKSSTALFIPTAISKFPI